MTNKIKLLKTYDAFKSGLKENRLNSYMVDNSIQLLMQMDICGMSDTKRTVSFKANETVLNYRFNTYDKTQNIGIVELIEAFYNNIIINSDSKEIYQINLQAELKMLDKLFNNYADAVGNTTARNCYQKIKTQLSRINRLATPKPIKDNDLVALNKNGKNLVKVSVKLDKQVYRRLSYIRAWYGFQTTKDTLEHLIVSKPLKDLSSETRLCKNILKFLSYVDGVSDKVIVEDFGDFLNEERSRLLIKSKRMFVRVAIKVSPEADLKPFKGLGVSTCFNERLKGLEEETPIGKTCWKQSPIDRNKLIKDLKRSLISLQKNEKPHAVRNCLKIFRRTIQTHYGLVLKPNHTQVSCFINVRNDLYLRLVKLSSAYGFNSIKETAAYCVDPL